MALNDPTATFCTRWSFGDLLAEPRAAAHRSTRPEGDNRMSGCCTDLIQEFCAGTSGAQSNAKPRVSFLWPFSARMPVVSSGAVGVRDALTLLAAGPSASPFLAPKRQQNVVWEGTCSKRHQVEMEEKDLLPTLAYPWYSQSCLSCEVICNRNEVFPRPSWRTVLVVAPVLSQWTLQSVVGKQATAEQPLSPDAALRSRQLSKARSPALCQGPPKFPTLRMPQPLPAFSLLQGLLRSSPNSWQ